jgi:hypothetical protein
LIKRVSVNLSNFFENENIVAHEVLSPTGNFEAASQLYNACIS